MKLELILHFPIIIFLQVKLEEQHSMRKEGKMDLAAAAGIFMGSLMFYLENKGELLLQIPTEGSFCSAEHILLMLLLA